MVGKSTLVSSAVRVGFLPLTAPLVLRSEGAAGSPLRGCNDLGFSAQPMIQVFAVGTAFLLPNRIGSLPDGLLSHRLPLARGDGGYDRRLGFPRRGGRCRPFFGHYVSHDRSAFLGSRLLQHLNLSNAGRDMIVRSGSENTLLDAIGLTSLPISRRCKCRRQVNRRSSSRTPPSRPSNSTLLRSASCSTGSSSAPTRRPL
jgi:hypothetical protein